MAGYANALASELGYHLVVRSGDRTTIPRNGARSSNHLVKELNPNRTGAIDFKAYTTDGELVPFGQLFSEALDAQATGEHGARLIWHGETTATTGQHLHADKSKNGHKYENGEMKDGRAVYRDVEKKP